MTTFGQLTDSTVMYLNGFTTAQDQATHLTENITASDTTIPVADTAAISRGLCEIGGELVWVDSVNMTASSVVVAPYGRGFRGTTATSHSTGDRFVASPMFPRAVVQDAMKETLRALVSDLYATDQVLITTNPAVSTYELPAGTFEVLEVAFDNPGPSGEWSPVRRWRLDKNADTNTYTSGVSLSIYDPVYPGRDLKVTVAKPPTIPTSDSDDFETTTGLSESVLDLVRIGAAYRLVPFLDVAHMSGFSAEADFSSNMRPATNASSISRYLVQLYAARLEEEKRRLQSMYPVRVHYTR